MRAIFKYIFITASRDLFFVALAVLLVITCGIGLFLGQISLVEQTLTSSALIAGGSRFVLIIGFISFVSFYIKRLIDTKELQFILSTPISRARLSLSLFGSFASLAAALIIILMSLFKLLGLASFFAIIIWGSSLFTEVCLIISFTLAVAFIIRSAVSTILFSLAFYVLARLNGYLISFAYNSAFETNLPIKLQILCTNVMKFIGLLLPRLDLATQTKWLLYPIDNYREIIIANIMSIVFSSMFLIIAINDLNKQEL